RFLAKLFLGVLLLLIGVVSNYVWWVLGPADFNHLIVAQLFTVPVSGLSLLLHMYRNRGLYVLIYPTGLLRLRRGEVDSFPWSEVDHIKVKVQRAAGPVVVQDGAGNLTGCWLPVDIPTVKIWEGGLTIAREDGAEARFG